MKLKLKLIKSKKLIIFQNIFQDQTLIIWKYSDKKWTSKCSNKKFDYPLWKLSWSDCGSYLAVTGGDNIVTVFSENIDGSYEEIVNINPETNIDKADELILDE